MSVRFELAPVASLPPGSMQAFDAGGLRVLVCNVDGTFHAIEELCPHLAVPLGQGELRGAEVTCPGHGSVFDVASGTCVRWIGRRPGALARLLSGSAATPQRLVLHELDGVLVVELP